MTFLYPRFVLQVIDVQNLDYSAEHRTKQNNRFSNHESRITNHVTSSLRVVWRVKSPKQEGPSGPKTLRRRRPRFRLLILLDDATSPPPLEPAWKKGKSKDDEKGGEDGEERGDEEEAVENEEEGVGELAPTRKFYSSRVET